MRPSARRSVRTLACTIGAVGGWHLLSEGWRTLEAAIVAGTASVGPGRVEWAGGDQIWVTGDAAPFVVVVGPLCSSVGPAVVALAACASFARTLGAVRSVARAVALLFLGNLVRMVAVVVIGARDGAADLEVAHDGWATWWAVAVVLGATVVVARALRRDERRYALVTGPVTSR